MHTEMHNQSYLADAHTPFYIPLTPIAAKNSTHKPDLH